CWPSSARSARTTKPASSGRSKNDNLSPADPRRRHPSRAGPAVDGVAAVAPPLLTALVGPTAAGKSALGLRLALAQGGEIVSCDSLQGYRGPDVGGAKPTMRGRRRVRHHLVDGAAPTR